MLNGRSLREMLPILYEQQRQQKRGYTTSCEMCCPKSHISNRTSNAAASLPICSLFNSFKYICFLFTIGSPMNITSHASRVDCGPLGPHGPHGTHHLPRVKISRSSLKSKNPSGGRGGVYTFLFFLARVL